MERRDTLVWLLAMVLFVAGATLMSSVYGAPSQTTPPAREGELAPPEKLPPDLKDNGKDDEETKNQPRAGVIPAPPTGDEEAVKKPPPTGADNRMPVIPPPGSPGGKPDVIPK